MEREKEKSPILRKVPWKNVNMLYKKLNYQHSSQLRLSNSFVHQQMTGKQSVGIYTMECCSAIRNESNLLQLNGGQNWKWFYSV